MGSPSGKVTWSDTKMLITRIRYRTAVYDQSDRRTVWRKVKKIKLLEFTGGCRVRGQFTKVGLNWT